MRGEPRTLWCVVVLFALLSSAPWAYPQTLTSEVPSSFKTDLETAARLRPQLVAQSVPALKRYATGVLVFERLVAQAKGESRVKFAWELRIVEDGQLNAYASPEGTVYVESGLAQIAGRSNGLWAALLSHEISHVIRRDWARRYLYQKKMESSGTDIVLGDPGVPSGSWTSSEKASAEMASLCREMELDADREALILMARTGYHPDFVPALHHLLHAQESARETRSLYAMHPCWEERDRELSRAYTAAAIEFDHHWPEWYASPGGNPPIVVFAEPPMVRKRSDAWEIQVPMRCQNLVGAVEVVLRVGGTNEKTERAGRLPSTAGAENEIRQLTGCTSPKTTITFTLDTLEQKMSATRQTDVYVLDAWGAVLARADVLKLPH